MAALADGGGANWLMFGAEWLEERQKELDRQTRRGRLQAWLLTLAILLAILLALVAAMGPALWLAVLARSLVVLGRVLLGDLPKLIVARVPKRTELKERVTVKTKSKSKDWATSLGWFIPRKYRHVIGDILEDCAEMREAGCTERRIKFHVLYQWLIAVITLVPMAVKTSITDTLKQVISPPK